MLFLYSLVTCFICVNSLDFKGFTNNSNNIFNVKVIERIEKEKYLTNDNADTYYLEEHKWYIGGKRIRGDSFRYEMFDKYEFPELRDFLLDITFPKQEQFYITQVMIYAQQSSTVGKAYIIDGGIGYTHMHLVIEAHHTRYFYFQLQMFGRNFT
ncbi:hypothetical protein ACKWTF_002216 [Chironomus riparius]